MFDVDKIGVELLGLVGIRQPYNPAYQKIDPTNQASRSGRFLDDIPYYKTEFHIDTQDYEDISDADLNTQLREIQRASVVSVCQHVFDDNSYIDRNLLYPYATTRQTTETTLINGFVGYKIKPAITKDVAFKITELRLEFDAVAYPQDITIVLFNSALNTPIYSQVVTLTSNFQIESLDWVVNNTKGDYKGEYYLGYVYDGTLTPYKRDYESSNVMNDLSELCFNKVYVEGGTDTTLFDLSQVKYLSENTGLNPDITVYEDYTDLILQNENLFAKAIQIAWAVNIMQRYISSTRSNRLERLSKEVVLQTIQQIEGSVPQSSVKVTGLNSIFAGEIKQLRKTIKDLKKGYFGEALQVQTLG